MSCLGFRDHLFGCANLLEIFRDLGFVVWRFLVILTISKGFETFIAWIGRKYEVAKGKRRAMAGGHGGGGHGGGGPGGGGGAAPPPKQDELQPHPAKDQLPSVSYCITSPPPWRQFPSFPSSLISSFHVHLYLYV